MNKVLVIDKAMASRAIAVVGIGLGLAAIWTDLFSSEHAKYADDGTMMAYLLVTLILAALLLLAGFAGRRGLDGAAAISGAAAFGFLLFYPAALAFDGVGIGGWFGVCTVLVPIGAWMAHVSGRSGPPARRQPPPLAAVPVSLGMILCLVGIWLPAEHGIKFWDFGLTGHLVGFLLLELIILLAILVLAALGRAVPVAADAGLLVAGVTFGLAESLVIVLAFNHLGELRVGTWLITAGGAILLAGAWWLQAATKASAPETKPKPVAAKKTRS
jgi:hypothetical protein